MLDTVTSDDDKVTPVYRLDEICELLQSSPGDVVREMVEYIVKRLDYKSPYVKQKALRLIKFALPKAGKEFRRELQRHSGSIRALFHYRGQPDPLKGDAPNKGVRDAAHDAIAVMFDQDEPRPHSAFEGTGRRMEGFGSNGETFSPSSGPGGAAAGSLQLSDIVEFGKESLEKGLTLIRDAAQSSGVGYKGRGLGRSLTATDGGGVQGGRYESQGRYTGPAPEASYSGFERYSDRSDFSSQSYGGRDYQAGERTTPRGRSGGEYGDSDSKARSATPCDCAGGRAGTAVQGGAGGVPGKRQQAGWGRPGDRPGGPAAGARVAGAAQGSVHPGRDAEAAGGGARVRRRVAVLRGGQQRHHRVPGVPTGVAAGEVEAGA